MKIAIGIPAYKAQKTIEECLASIDIQTMRDDINVIISNDNPGVDDYSYLKNKFSKLHITLTQTEKNSGPGVARNKAIEVSKDDYIMFMDADDILYTPYAVDQLYNGVIAQPNIIQ
jgi:glycosyltransferase involved in cell wall biosynthesis